MAGRTSKPHLDRGAAFDSLFQVAKGERVAPGLKLIDRGRIVVREQARREFDPALLAELSRSIQELQERGAGIEGTGILLPLLVVAEGSGYYLVAGERRFRASAPRESEPSGENPAQAWQGVAQLPCLVLEAAKEEISLLQLVENMQRQDLGPLEEARAFQVLLDERSLSQRDLARLLGKSRGYITNRLSLLSYSPDVQEMVVLRKTTIMHAPLIQAVQDPDLRRDLIQRVVHEDISITDLQAQIEQGQPSQAEVQRDSPPQQGGLAQDHPRPPKSQAPKKPPAQGTVVDSQEQIEPDAAHIEGVLRHVAELKSHQSAEVYKQEIQRTIITLRVLLSKLEEMSTDC